MIIGTLRQIFRVPRYLPNHRRSTGDGAGARPRDSCARPSNKYYADRPVYTDTLSGVADKRYYAPAV